MKTSRVWLLAIFLVVVACKTTGTPPQMSDEEARDAVLSMQSTPLEPPPRKMDHILALLDSARYAGQDHMAELLLQSYIDMLIEIRSQQNEQAYGIDVVNEIFKLTDARYSQVSSALGESAARAGRFSTPGPGPCSSPSCGSWMIPT